jgi:hypothetical protein
MEMTVREFRRMSAAMDLDIQHLAREGVHGPVMIERMVGHLPDLQQIWTGTSDDQLTTLCQEFPGFHQYARLMEEAAERERSKPSHPCDDLPELPDALKDRMAALLTTLERRYRAVLDADPSTEREFEVIDLNRLHRAWLADLEQCTSLLQRSAVLQKTIDIFLAAFHRIDARIAQVQNRAMTGD